jgi:hypothetical protein
MKCFERLVMDHINTIIPDTKDPIHIPPQQIHRSCNLYCTPHCPFPPEQEEHLLYMSMLFIDYRSALNTIVPSKLTSKLWTLGLNTSLCNWILDFLTDRPPGGEGGQQHNRHADPQHVDPLWVRPLLYFLFTHDCVATHDTKTIITFSDNTTVVGLITDGDETIYSRGVKLKYPVGQNVKPEQSHGPTLNKLTF